MGLRNHRGNLNGLEAFIDVASAAASITSASGPHRTDYSVSKTGTGDYSLVLSNFRGPRGLAWVTANSQTISTFVSVTSVSYSGQDLTIVLKIEADDSTATDAAVFVHVYAE